MISCFRKGSFFSENGFSHSDRKFANEENKDRQKYILITAMDFEKQSNKRNVQDGKPMQEQISDNIFRMVKATNDIREHIKEIGTARDDRKLREKLSKLREETKKIIETCKSALNSNEIRTNRIQYGKLSQDFNDALQNYEKEVKISLEKERAFVVALNEVIESRRDTGKSFSNKLTEINLDEVDEKLIEEKNKDIRQVEKELEELGHLFVDIANTVQDQGKTLGRVESETESADANTKQGVRSVKEASVLACSARIKVLIIILILFVIFCIIFFPVCFTGNGACVARKV
jgi:t-SNARE complex subunit (syntaxin)